MRRLTEDDVSQLGELFYVTAIGLVFMLGVAAAFAFNAPGWIAVGFVGSAAMIIWGVVYKLLDNKKRRDRIIRNRLSDWER